MIKDLEKYISPRGFLSAEDPLPTLPKKYDYIETIGKSIPDALEKRVLREALNSLNPYDVADLKGPEINRAFMLYSFLASAYVYSPGLEIAKNLPVGVALPLYKLSTMLRKPPILSYDSYILNNWKRKDPEQPVVMENLETFLTFYNLSDESWFILIHIQIEDEASLALKSVIKALKAIEEVKYPTKDLVESLTEVKQSTNRMVTTLSRMRAGNNPDLYHRTFRENIMYFQDVVYEGVCEYQDKPQSFRGTTAAQSSILPSLDAAFGINHEQSGLTNHISEMRKYMPYKHQRFIEGLESIDPKKSIRGYIKSSQNKTLIGLYNQCLYNMSAFRSQHLEWADTYINKKVTNPYGTGGTEFMAWLTKIRDETTRSQIKI